MKASTQLTKQLNAEFDEGAYLMNRLINGNKKRQASVRLQKRAMKVLNG